VFHVYNPKRVSQTRGVGALAPVFTLCDQFDDINFAQLVKQQVAACFAIFREREHLTQFEQEQLAAQQGPRETESLPDGSTRILEGIAPGMQIRGKPGEKLQGFAPNIPGEGFFQHMKLVLQIIGVNLGLPLAVVLLDASETNFSGWRGAIEQARIGFRRNQESLISKFHRPVYHWKVRQWLAEDPELAKLARATGVKVFNHLWHAPEWSYIDPLKDAAADLLQVRNGLISPRRMQAKNGRQHPVVAREIVEDNALSITIAMEKAREINLKYSDQPAVHWRELLSLPTPDGVTVTIAPESGTTAAPAKEKQRQVAA
jgi:capsid protein